MALQKRDFPIVLEGGLDQKHDLNSVIPSKLTSLLNCVFDDKNTIVGRPGLEQVSTTPIGSYPSISTAYRPFTHRDSLLIEHAAGISKLVSGRGTAPVVPRQRYGDAGFSLNFFRCSKLERPISGAIDKVPSAVTTPICPTNFDVAYGNGVSVWAWDERNVNGTGRMGIRVSVRNEADNVEMYSTLIADNVGTEIYTNPRVVYAAASQNFYIYHGHYASGATVYNVGAWSVTQASGYIGVNILADVFTSTAGATADRVIFDADVTSTRIGLVVLDNNGPPATIYALSISQTDGVTIPRSSNFTPATQVETLTALCIDPGGGATFVLALYARSTNSVYGYGQRLDAPGTKAETLLATGGVGTSIGRIVAYDSDPGGSEFILAFDNSTTATYANPPTAETRLVVAKCLKTLAASSDWDYFDGWLIHGRIFSLRSKYYLPMFFPDIDTPSAFVVDLSASLSSQSGPQRPQVLARLAYGEAGYIREDWYQHMRVPASVAPSATRVTIPFTKWVADLQRVAGVFVTPMTIQRCDFDIGSVDYPEQLGQAEMNGLTQLAGACPYFFDGSQFVESGFHHRPCIFSAVAAAGATYPVGTFGICYTQQWQDSAGNTHESAPSNVKTVTTTGGNQNLTIVLGVAPSQKVTAQTILWRSTVASPAGPFYRAIDENGNALTDVNLVSGEQLYSTGAQGDILPNDPTPSHRQASIWQNRIFLVGAGDGYDIYFSKPAVAAFAPSFSVGFNRRIPEAYGRGIAGIPLGNKFVVICERKIGVIYGVGPENTGAGDNYSQIEPLVENAGGVWQSPLSVVQSKEGVWFQSPFGMRLVNGGGGLVSNNGIEAGAEVSIPVGSQLQAVTDAGSKKQQIRWYETTGSGRAYLWDIHWQQWSVFTDQLGAAGAAYAGGNIYSLASSGFLARENDSLARDLGVSAVTSSLTTGNMNFDGVRGFVRLYRLQLFGANTDSSTGEVRFTLQVYNDDVLTFTSSAPASVSTFPMVLEHHMTVQKCSSVRLVITFSSQTEARFRLTGLRLQTGLKQGLPKVPSTKRF